MQQAALSSRYESQQARRRTFSWLVLATIVATYGLIVLGGIVRITGSGMGCGDDWPLCHGQIIPPFQLDVLIEYGHRLAASVISVLILAVAIQGWRGRGADRRSYRLGMLALGLVVFQVILGAITVKLELHAMAVVLHLGTAMILFATLLVLATQLLRSQPSTGSDRTLQRLVLISSGMIYLTLISGAAVAGSFAGWACPAFPHCGGAEGRSVLKEIHMLHRIQAIGTGALVIGTVVRAWRQELLRPAALAALGFTLAQIGVGIAQVLLSLPSELRALHLALATAAWGSLVVMTTLTRGQTSHSSESASQLATGRS